MAPPHFNEKIHPHPPSCLHPWFSRLLQGIVEMFYLNSTLNFEIPPVLVFQLEAYYKVDRLLTGLTAQRKGTTQWYSNKTSLFWISIMFFLIPCKGQTSDMNNYSSPVTIYPNVCFVNVYAQNRSFIF